MTDNGTAPDLNARVIQQEVAQVRLKHIEFKDQGAREKTLESVVMLLASLVQNQYREVTIADPIHLMMGEERINLGTSISFKIQTDKRNLQNKDEQRITIYLDEVVTILKSVSDWLSSRYRQTPSESNIALGIEKNTRIQDVERMALEVLAYFALGQPGTKTPTESYQFFYINRLFSRFKDIQEGAEELLIAANELDRKLVPEVFGFNSLQDLLGRLESAQDVGELIATRNSWYGTFLPFLEAAQKLETNAQGNQVIVLKEKPSLLNEFAHNGHYSPTEVKKLFHLWLVKGLRKLVDDPKNDHGYLTEGVNKGKAVARVLTSEEIAKINDNGQRFYIPEVDDNLEELLKKSGLDEATRNALAALLEFLQRGNDPIMAKLLGEKAVDIEVVEEAAEAPTSDAGGGDNQPLLPPVQLTYDQIKEQIVTSLALELLRKTPEFLQLEFIVNTFTPVLYPLSHALYTEVLELTKNELLSPRYPLAMVQLSPETIATLGTFNPETGTYSVQPDILPAWQQTLARDFLPEIEAAFKQNFQATLSTLAERIQQTITGDEEAQADQKTQSELGTEENKQQLKDTIEAYRDAGEAAGGALDASLETQYQGRLSDVYVGAANVFAPFIVRELLEKNKDLLLQNGLTDLTVEGILRENPELIFELTNYFREYFRTHPEDAITLFFGETGAKFALLAELRTEILKELYDKKFNPIFKEFVVEAKSRKDREQYLTGIKTEFAQNVTEFAVSENELTDIIANSSGNITKEALNRRLESLVGLIAQMDDPAAYITGLSSSDLAELLGVRFQKDDPALKRFRDKLIRHVDLFIITHHGLKGVDQTDLAEANIPNKPQVKLFSSAPNAAPTPKDLKQTSQMVEQAGGYDSWNDMLASEGGVSKVEQRKAEGASAEEIRELELWERQRDLLIKKLWEGLDEADRQELLAKRAAQEQAQYAALAAAAGAAGAGFPPGETIGGVMGHLSEKAAAAPPTPTQQPSFGSRARDAWNTFRGKPPESSNPAGKMASSAAKAATEMGLNAVAPGAGTALMAASDLIKKLTGLDSKGQFFAALGIGGLATYGLGRLLHFLLNFNSLGWWLGAGPGAIAGYAAGGPLGAFMGGASGGMLGHGILGPRPSLGGLSQTASNVTGIGKSATVAKAVGTTVETSGAAQTGAFASLGSQATAFAVGTTLVTSSIVAMVNVVTSLQPLPTISGDGISPYIEIIKTASPGIEFENTALPQEITYTITIRAKEGYNLTITELNDSMTIRTNSQTRQGVPDPSVPLARTLDDFGKTAPLTINSGESLVIGSYTETFGPEYQDSNVVNTVNVSFTVAEGEGFVEGQSTPIPTDTQTAFTKESICFGACPLSQGGCWPVAGIVTQVPFYSGGSHARSDAFDIGVAEGTPVFSPFNGSITHYSNNSGGSSCTRGNYPGDCNYGISVLITSNVNGQTAQIVLAHLLSVNAETLADGTVEVGDEIGLSGSTGNSTGPHLHYELYSNIGGSSSILRSLVPDGENVAKDASTRPVCEK